MESKYIAHIAEDGRKQSVGEHCRNTAELSKKFASVFGAGELGYVAGLLHDIGKYSEDFQRRIRGAENRVDHSTAGAKIAWKKQLFPAAFAIAGHHGGIPDGGSQTDTSDDVTMYGRLKRQIKDFSAWEKEIFLPETDMPDWVVNCSDSFSMSFFIRMLYSCLVDADFIDTETFMQGKMPRGDFETPSELLQKLNKKTELWLNGNPTDQVNIVRNNILTSCINCGKEKTRGLYTLTVPTGGGKTIASLSFALEQAVSQNMNRIIYVIPYTSIIDQTVDVFKKILGEDAVLAHYAEAEYFIKNREDLTVSEYKQLLAAENWEMPVIITTAVQFFESLFSNRSSKCRKLHNIANSVIIFDEAQTLPLPYLRPGIAAIAQLVQHYRTTVILCTATQPALGKLFEEYGLSSLEICSNSTGLYKAFRRTSLIDLGAISQECLAEKLSVAKQVLCVVNRRKTAQDIYSALPQEGTFCLTTLSCGADRNKKLKEIRRRLRDGLPCRVISTSLIEAGVDVDFPVAYREEAGLDSFLQTAGRCNREGKEKNPENCPVYLFSLEGVNTLSTLKQQTAAFRTAQRLCDALDQPDAIECYFDTLIYKIKDKEELDRKGILDAFCRGKNGVAFPFEFAAREFNLIENNTRTIYIPYENGRELCDKLCAGEVDKGLFRRLGPYSISVYGTQFDALYGAGALKMVNENVAVLIDFDQYYDENTGLCSEASGGRGIFFD